jgi:hypothetical protein
MRWTIAIVITLLAATGGAAASTEKAEFSMGLHAGLLLPNYETTSNTAFTLATWQAGIHASYGITNELSVISSFALAVFEAQVDGYTTQANNRQYTGTLLFDTAIYHPEVGMRYLLLGGYDLAPLVEMSIGYAWSAYTDTALRDADGNDFGVTVDDFAEGTPTVSAGFLIDYRLYNIVFVGAAVRFKYGFGGNLLEHLVECSLYASAYW